MMTLRLFSAEPQSIPMRTTWYLTELAEARGKQELFTMQSPQKLKVLREHAIIESAISSNRIEGVEVEKSRIGTLVFGKSKLRDREEEEVRGYTSALNLIHTKAAGLEVSEATVKEFHVRSRGKIWDAGLYKDKPVDIIETYADGRSRVRFRSVSPAATPAGMTELIELWNRGMHEHWMHPLVLLAAFNLDFLCIHPFRDGNGRVSRLLLLQCLYRCGIEAGRYISLERLIENNKERYYETLEMSSQHWHEGTHDPWPYINYLLFILTQACKEFEERVGQMQSPRGEKTEMILAAIGRQLVPFRVGDLQRECPGVSMDMIRYVLNQLRKESKVACFGTGRSAKWDKTASYGS